MYIIKGSFKDNSNSRHSWYVSGLDMRPLRYTSYGVAERERHFFQEQNRKNMSEYGDEEVIYEVVEETRDQA